MHNIKNISIKKKSNTFDSNVLNGSIKVCTKAKNPTTNIFDNNNV